MRDIQGQFCYADFMVDFVFEVPDELLELLNQRAAKNGRTAEEEYRAILLETFKEARPDGE